MTPLVRDRYFAYDREHAWDLATGDVVLLADLDSADDRSAPCPPPPPLVEVLDHGREGEPRWVALDADERPAAAVVRSAADAARARGYVALSAVMYTRLRDVLAEELSERTLLLIVTPGASLAVARTALLAAAAGSPRPHVLLSVGAFTEPRADPAPIRNLWLVREGGAVYAARPHPLHAPAPVPEDVARHVARGARAPEFVRAGRHAAAERLLRDVAAALVRRRSHPAAAQTSIALGRLLLERGRPADAESAFVEAATHADAAKDEPLACCARVWQAAARTDAGRLTAAEALVRAALLCGTMTADQRALASATLARVLLWQGRAEEAGGLDLRPPDVNAESYAFVSATAVRVLIEGGRLFDAGQMARALLDSTAVHDDPVGAVLGLTAHLRVLLRTGDLRLGERCLGDLSRAARHARAPLRLVRARLLWLDALVRAGRTRDQQAEIARLQRVRGAAPPLLREAIDRRTTPRPTGDPPRPWLAIQAPSAAATLVTIAQGEENDDDAVTRVLELTAHTLQASRIEMCSADAGPPTAVSSLGGGIATRLGPRVLEAGIAIGPEPGDPSREVGVPVRLGARLVAALVARWPVDRTPPPQARELLSLAAAAAAPRVDAMLTRARESAQASTLVPELVGASAPMSDVRKAIARAAHAPFAVLIEGESGVGKELVARAVHHLGARRERRFCDVNCAALPDELLESELFGHARGAFTGAVADRPGLVEEADGGTLFLDEVADLSPRAQAKLLRVIQQQEVRRVGETFTRRVDVRIVSAANRDIRVEAAERRFRQDLLYRLDVIRIRIPPLRERPEDVARLAEHFWRGAAARVGTQAVLTHAVLTALTRYHWPGNVRELQNVMAALAVAAPARGQVRPALLPAVVTSTTAVTSGRLAEARVQFERRFVEVALARAGGSRAQAARELGLSRQGLLKMLERHGRV